MVSFSFRSFLFCWFFFFCLFCLSQKFPSLFFVFFALLFETNSFQPACTSTKEIHKFIFLGLFRDFKQPKPVSFCLSLPLSSKEGRRSAFTTSLTPSPPLPSLFSHQFRRLQQKSVSRLFTLSLSLFLSLSSSSSSSFFRRRHRNNKKEKN